MRDLIELGTSLVVLGEPISSKKILSRPLVCPESVRRWKKKLLGRQHYKQRPSAPRDPAKLTFDAGAGALLVKRVYRNRIIFFSLSMTVRHDH